MSTFYEQIFRHPDGPSMSPTKPTSTWNAAMILGILSVLLGVALIAWSFSADDGLHPGGLISVVLGLLAIVAGRAGRPPRR